jgi:hypothetical protein
VLYRESFLFQVEETVTLKGASFLSMAISLLVFIFEISVQGEYINNL